jgi:hypothetical protein
LLPPVGGKTSFPRFVCGFFLTIAESGPPERKIVNAFRQHNVKPAAVALEKNDFKNTLRLGVFAIGS